MIQKLRSQTFLLNLECLDAPGQHDALVNEVEQAFGRLTPPSGDRTHWWELDLHGITAEGVTVEDALAKWKKFAHQRRKLDTIEGDGFITVYPPTDQIGAA